MHALVTGGNGFIGSHLVDRLVEQGWNVTVLDLYERRYDPLPARVHFIKGDLTQAYLVREALIGVDIVFHLAWATIHEISNQDPAADVIANLIPTIHLLETCRNAGARRVVFTSSGGTVYGPAQSWPISEAHPQNPVNGYGITKLAVEKYLHMFHHLYGLDYVILRPSVPYGPRQNPLARQGAVAVFLYRVARGLPVTIWGDGSIIRDYFYVSDLVEALVASSKQDLGQHRIFNIGGPEEISLLQLLSQIEETVGRTAKVEYGPARRFDAPKIVLDTRLTQQELGWQSRITLAQGLKQTWQWMLATVE
ncbi:MAG: NAD-dependent dehydratase [Chloroflexota bacterium]|nr:MAG: NAD-dependent dehydratase [Chloroflexota bacterium]